MSENEIVHITDADDVTVMLKKAFKGGFSYPSTIKIVDREIGGDRKTIVHGVAHARFRRSELSPTNHHEVEFDFEINAGTTANDIVLDELEVVINTTGVPINE